MLIIHISLKDVEILEGVFAKLTPDGWIFPQWLISLREEVINRDKLKVA